MFDPQLNLILPFSSVACSYYPVQLFLFQGYPVSVSMIINSLKILHFPLSYSQKFNRLREIDSLTSSREISAYCIYLQSPSSELKLPNTSEVSFVMRIRDCRELNLCLELLSAQNQLESDTSLCNSIQFFSFNSILFTFN